LGRGTSALIRLYISRYSYALMAKKAVGWDIIVIVVCAVCAVIVILAGLRKVSLVGVEVAQTLVNFTYVVYAATVTATGHDGDWWS
jgi:hypothetical protein